MVFDLKKIKDVKNEPPMSWEVEMDNGNYI